MATRAKTGSFEQETSAVVEISAVMDPYREYQAKTEQQAARDFEKHQIKARGDGRWTIASKYKDTDDWCGQFLTEIIVGINGTLIAHGDISPTIFVSHSSYPDPLQTVHWVARSSISGYLQTKASCGLMESGVHTLTQTFDEKVAVWKLKNHLKDRLDELEVEHDGDKNGDEEVAAWRRAIRNIKSEHWEIVRKDLYDDLQDSGCTDIDEFIWNIGMVPAVRLYYAQAACRKLLELLEREKDDTETR